MFLYCYIILQIFDLIDPLIGIKGYNCTIKDLFKDLNSKDLNSVFLQVKINNDGCRCTFLLKGIYIKECEYSYTRTACTKIVSIEIITDL